MRILEKNTPKPIERTCYCTHCLSMLAVTDGDLRRVGDHHEATCAVCHKAFRCMTEAEQVEAYYNK